MSIMKKIPAALVIAGLLASASFADSAGADDAAGKMLLKVRAGLAKTKGEWKFNDSTKNENKKKNGYGVEVAASYFFMNNVALEGSLGYTSAKVGLGEKSKDGTKDKLNVVPVTLLAQYHIMPDASFSPYVGAGYSYQFSSTSNVKSAGAFVAQLGADMPFNDTVGLNVDLKHAFDASHKVKKTDDVTKVETNTTSFMVGLTFPF